MQTTALRCPVSYFLCSLELSFWNSSFFRLTVRIVFNSDLCQTNARGDQQSRRHDRCEQCGRPAGFRLPADPLPSPIHKNRGATPSALRRCPTAHDEPAIRLGIYRDVFSSAAGIIWNTEVERKFVTSMFHLRAVVEDVVGCGVDMPEGAAEADDDEPPADTGMGREILAPHLEGPANVFRRRHRIHGPFALYGGRIDPGKGCEELLEYFQTYVKEGGDASLMLMGVKLMPLPDDPHVRFAGVLPDEERMHALEAATVVVVPSPHESLSLLTLEAFAVGTPVLANARADVLVEHCRQSNAGLYYADRWEFVEALKLLMRDPELRRAMGRNGKIYVDRHYRWSTIMAKYERLLTRLRGPARDAGRDQARPYQRPRAEDERQRPVGQRRPDGRDSRRQDSGRSRPGQRPRGQR